MISNSSRDPFEFLKSLCSVTSGDEGDRFVGLRVEDSKVSISFPLGYTFPETYLELQDDILKLIRTIKRASLHTVEMGFSKKIDGTFQTDLPLTDFIFLLEDYLRSHSLIAESSNTYLIGDNGVISWSRTIAEITPAITKKGGAVYPQFIVRKSMTQQNSLLMQAHAYCISLSFQNVGWLYRSALKAPILVPRVGPMHVAAVSRALMNTFNDRERMILSSILRIIKDESWRGKTSTYEYGTSRFEYVWEYMIDTIFGVKDKNRYFPRATWLVGAFGKEVAPLEPDSVMELTDSNELFILDAKYYRFCDTHRVKDLPGSSAIGKQIIYGQYANLVELRRPINERHCSIYNAFLLPGRNSLSKNSRFKHFASANGNWIDKPKMFEIIVVITVDTRFILQVMDSPRESYKHELASEILKALQGRRDILANRESTVS